MSKLFSVRKRWDICTTPDCWNSAVGEIHCKVDETSVSAIIRVCHHHLSDRDWVEANSVNHTVLSIRRLEAIHS